MELTTTYMVYLGISAAVTVAVGTVLRRRGRVFLVDSMHGNETLADAVNDLLIVGFYLINFGYVALALRYGTKPINTAESIEFLSTKIGLVLLVLGVMHFFNVIVLSRVRRRSKPPVVPEVVETGVSQLLRRRAENNET